MLSLLEAYFAVSGWKHFFLDGGCTGSPQLFKKESGIL